MAKGSQIWLADVVSLMERLEIRDDWTLAQVMKVLGFELGVPTIPEHRDERTADELGKTAASSFPAEGPPQLPKVRELAEEVPELEPVATEEQWPIPEGWREVDKLEPVEARHRDPNLPYRSLFSPIGTLPLLTASVATDGPGGPIDIESLVARLSRAQPVTEIPHLPRPSLFRGVRVLAEVSPSMEPFERDQLELIEELRGLVGRSMVEVEWYDESPLRGCGTDSLGCWKPFTPPHPGTPVLVLGDLGIAADRGDIEAEWHQLSEMLARRESRLVALVPYPAHRWPRRLLGVVDMVVWDRSTSINDISFRLRP